MSFIYHPTTAINSRWLLLLLFLALPAISVAATFTVNSYLDDYDKHPGDGVCEDHNGHCTLRAAINEGEYGPTNAYTISVPGGAYKLTKGTLRISKTVEIRGGFDIECKSNKGIAFTVRPWGILELHASIIRGCKIALSINDNAIAVVYDAGFSGNKQAIVNYGYLQLLSGWFRDNSGARPGAAIENHGRTKVLGSVKFEDNHSDDRGGALYNTNTGTYHAQLGWFKNNTAGTAGGAIFNEGQLTVDFIQFEGNSALAGGAIENAAYSGTKPLISRCSFVKNEATGNLPDQCGGAIRQTKGAFFIANSTLSENMANGNGSALCSTGGQAYIGNVTITKNIANRNFNEAEVDGGALFGQQDKGLLIITNSIVTDNQAGGDGAGDCAGKVRSKGHNIIGILDENHCEFTQETDDLIGTADNPIDAGLLPLAYKLTAYHSLSAGSPAINSADHTACMAEPHDANEFLSDQIEVPHDYFGTCDRGSVEFMEQ